METGLRLLMRDGSLHVLFRPKLTSEEYDELLAAVRAPQTVAELRDILAALAAKWGKQLDIDD